MSTERLPSGGSLRASLSTSRAKIMRSTVVATGTCTFVENEVTLGTRTRRVASIQVINRVNKPARSKN